MRQSRRLLLVGLIAAHAALSPIGCSKPAAGPSSGTIVSLSPAATDLLVAMGLTGRIVGVSPYEANEPLRKKLPKVGDYERIDWERMASLKPAFLIVQGKRDRLPPGVLDTAISMNVKTIILQIDRLADIRAAIKQLGEETTTADAAAKLDADLARRETALRQATTRPAVPAMLALGDGGTHFVGVDTFLDDALTLAGGHNVLTTRGYFALDAEKIASLRPRVVFLLLPAADDAAVERATASLRRTGLSPDAVVVAMRDKDVLMPGTAAYALAEAMAERLRALP